MIKRLILIAAIIQTPVYADLFHGEGYISPENYAVNEADMIFDYSHIPPAPRLNVDNLDDMRTQNLVEKDFTISDTEEVNTDDKNSKKIRQKLKKVKKEKSVSDDEAYKKKLSYKFAKWWVDQRYKREEEHHGSLHEIKVQKRIEYEQQQQQTKSED